MQDVDAIRFEEHAIRHLKTMIEDEQRGYFEDNRFPFIAFIERRTGPRPWKVWSIDTRMPKDQQVLNAEHIEFGDDRIVGAEAAVDMVLAALRARIGQLEKDKDQK
jgi:hypothetical protein